MQCCTSDSVFLVRVPQRSFWHNWENGRFSLLEPNFVGLTESEVLELDDDELLAACPRELQPLARLFIRHVVMPHREYQPRAPVAAKEKEPENVGAAITAGVLDLSCRLIPSYATSLRHVRGFSLERVRQDLQALKQKVRTSVTVLDVSRNNLANADVSDLVSFLELLPCLEEVNLCNNRLSSHEQLFVDLRRLLSYKPCPYVNILVNPAASADSVAFLASLTEAEARKLIWIPKQWLNSDSWQDMLRSAGNDGVDMEELLGNIKHGHEEYFRRRIQQHAPAT